MKKFCGNCGKEMGDGAFCPECGAREEQVTNYNNISFDWHNMDSKMYYIFLGALPLVYMILFLFNWFKISIPYIAEASFNCFSFMFGIGMITSNANLGGVGFLIGFVAFLMFVFVVLTFVFAIRAIIYSVKRNIDATSMVLNASLFSIIVSSVAILFMWLLQGIVDSVVKEDVFSVTIAPILLLIFAIAGKIVSAKIQDKLWNLENDNRKDR